ncbi:uncharacterized protein LOC141532037 [Cotesia typhae]|uniref:uncharacterized protein LOC141532037 n=1 Tax=Cotesia typhae TaxID=2053667 RepID=UPI003D687E08
MAASAIVFNTLKPVDTWISSTIDKILDIGDELYKKSINVRDQSQLNHLDSSNKRSDEHYLSATELVNNVNISGPFYSSFEISQIFDGHFCRNIDNSSFFLPLNKRLENVFEDTNTAAILTMNMISIAIISYNGVYYTFDSHSRNAEGKQDGDDGKSCLCCFESLDNVHEIVLSNMYIAEDNSQKDSMIALQRNMYTLSVINVEESLKKSDRNQNKSTPTQTTKTSSKPIPNPLPSNNLADDSTFDIDDTYRIKKPPRKYTRKPLKHTTKFIIDYDYVHNEINMLFDLHRESSREQACRTWQCKCNYVGSVLYGLQSVLFFECNGCEYRFEVQSEPDKSDELPTNQGILLGCFGSGIGFYQLEGLLASVNLPCYDYKSYHEMEIMMGLHVQRTAIQSMANAGAEAESRARLEGRITAVGNMAHTTVVVDGSWGKRSYKTGSFDSPSGLGVVIDYHTKKVLDVGVANQRCLQCQLGKELAHLCWCNYDSKKTSSSMESANILGLFQYSVEKHNLVYKTMIGDGDSSVIKAIHNHNPYVDFDVTVGKLLCTNHILRRLSTNLSNLASLDQFKDHPTLKNFLKVAGGKSSTAIRAAAKYWQSVNDSQDNKIMNMLRDLENMPNHVFGQHDDCRDHYCDGNKTEAKNHMDELIKINMWSTILGCFGTCISAPLDFLMNSNNNLAESFNNVVASKNFAKRVDSYKCGSYTFRVCYSVIQFNSKTAMCDVYTSMGKKVPDQLRHMENMRRKKVENNARRATEKGFRNRHPETNYSRSDAHYGPGANPPIMSPEVYQARFGAHEQKLMALQADRVNIERRTVGQSRSVEWHTTRRLYLTASNFKLACQCRKISTQNKAVREILYSPIANFHPAINHGIVNESQALSDLCKEFGVQIDKCGFFIDANILGLGATPDGLIGTDGIAEINARTP